MNINFIRCKVLSNLFIQIYAAPYGAFIRTLDFTTYCKILFICKIIALYGLLSPVPFTVCWTTGGDTSTGHLALWFLLSSGSVVWYLRLVCFLVAVSAATLPRVRSTQRVARRPSCWCSGVRVAAGVPACRLFAPVLTFSPVIGW